MKVAVYCRVSTDKEDQANSFESQKRFFEDYVEKQPGLELYRIYADEGISGTSTKKRTQFNKMIDDAHEGKFRRIITKEISRFSRNTEDTIKYTRELKNIGIGVLFLNDAIDTLDPDAELRLSIMASIAQEESRKTSSRVVWGQMRQMEKGVVFGQSLLGYDVEGGKLTINEEGAELVRLIFHKYAVEQMGTTEIARFLTREGYRTYRGSTTWKSNKIVKILKNEKYVGDLVQRKSFTPNYLTHEKRRNTGEVDLVFIQNHHEPIISREIWDRTQERLRQNNKHNGKPDGHSNRYVFSGKIKCGVCGSSFIGKQKELKDGSKIRRWRCGTEHCDVGRLVRDDDAINMIKTALQNLNIDRNALINDVTALALGAVLAGEEGTNDKPEFLMHEMERVQGKKERMLDSFYEGLISKEDMQAMNRKYDAQLASLRERLEKLKEEKCSSQEIKSRIREEITGLINGEVESDVFYKHLVEQLTVHQDRHLELKMNKIPVVFCFA